MTNFDFDIADDLQVSEDYQDVETGPRPPLPGNYGMSVTKWDFRKDKQGEIVKWKNSNGDPTYPVFNVMSIAISDPTENSRQVPGIFTDVSTYPFSRNGEKVSPAADLLRAFDVTVGASNTGEVIRYVSERMNSGEQFRGRIDYHSYDGEYAKRAIEAGGGKDALGKDAVNAIYKTAKIKGYRKIEAANKAAFAAGKQKTVLPITRWCGVDGTENLEARPMLTTFIPSDEVTNLGPDKALLK